MQQQDFSRQSNEQSAYPPSYYAATINDTDVFPYLDRDIEVETCIVGGGYAGLMTALGLIERGYTKIAILERNKVGWGASGRNGGFVFGGYSLGPRKLVKQVGEENAKNLYQLTQSAVELIRKRVHQYHIDCDLVDEGVIWANWFKDQSLLKNEQAFMKEKFAVDWRYLSPKQLSSIVNSERYHGGLFEPNAMHFHPLNYARGVAHQIDNTQAQIYENTEVIDVQYSSSGADDEKLVITANAKVRCKNIVLAGGGYLGKLCPPVANSVLPIATYVMATEPLGERLTECLRSHAAIYDTRFAFDYYRPLKDGRILWGGRVSAKTRTPRNLAKQLTRDLCKVFPQLSGVNVDFVWDGWMSYARHQMAQIGQLAPGVWYGVGFGGHGVAPTTTAGEILADAIANNSEQYRQFQPWGLPWNGGPFGPVAAQMSYWWYQLNDWFKERLGK
ncbi:NAD(P)/FAD-dependent oxidoreductase [Aliikangiella coralliicola]|uniref:FAD-binding oxidoreductase n=1 Tax=Aliikangiella coralliicola TaxID=2592383 RepID=A0A545TWB3_9GAMM|nr:FAD-binding oxidoreductase [Aliikangiella coralliicola]TQV81492.1 FAD-binding oxidoreductase [Aliikangiella coralliicola]